MNNKFTDNLFTKPFEEIVAKFESNINISHLPEAPKYEQTYFKKMADDIKLPIEQQVTAIEQIADSAKTQADASVNLANSAKIQADLSLAKSKKADIKGWIAIIISFIALLFQFAINSKTIIEFFTNLFN